MKDAGVEVRALPPAALVQPGAHQQPHPPQAAGRRRPDRLHRRRRHRRPLGRQCQDPRALARYALSASKARWSRRCRRRSSTTGSRRPATCCTASEYFPRWRRRATATRAGVQQLAQRRQRQHAADVPDGDHRRRAEDRPVGCLFRARRADRARRCVAARKRGVRVRIIVPGQAHRLRSRAPRLARELGRRCSPPASRSTSTSRRCSTARC